MKDLFRHAAEIMLLDSVVFGCCSAIAKAATDADCPSWSAATAVHRKMFQPDSPYKDNGYWMSGSPQYGGATQDRDRRVYSLLLAAEAWRDFT